MILNSWDVTVIETLSINSLLYTLYLLSRILHICILFTPNREHSLD